MIKSLSLEANFATSFTNGSHSTVSDTLAERGGAGAGFNPHELLEAALSCCLNITVRRYAAQHQIPLAGVVAEVSLNRQVPGETAFEYRLELNGPLADTQRQELLQAAEACAVHQTLSNKILFKRQPQ